MTGGDRLITGTIARLQPNAHVIENRFTVSRALVEQAEPKVADWLTTLGYKND